MAKYLGGNSKNSPGAASTGSIADRRVSPHELVTWERKKAGLRGAQEGKKLTPEEIASYAASHGMTVSDPASPRKKPAVELRPRNHNDLVRQLLNHKPRGAH